MLDESSLVGKKTGPEDGSKGAEGGRLRCFAARNTLHYTVASYIRDYFSFLSERGRQRASKSGSREGAEGGNWEGHEGVTQA